MKKIDEIPVKKIIIAIFFLWIIGYAIWGYDWSIKAQEKTPSFTEEEEEKIWEAIKATRH